MSRLADQNPSSRPEGDPYPELCVWPDCRYYEQDEPCPCMVGIPRPSPDLADQNPSKISKTGGGGSKEIDAQDGARGKGPLPDTGSESRVRVPAPAGSLSDSNPSNDPKLGIPVRIDPKIEPGVVELRDGEETVARIVLADPNPRKRTLPESLTRVAPSMAQAHEGQTDESGEPRASGYVTHSGKALPDSNPSKRP